MYLCLKCGQPIPDERVKHFVALGKSVDRCIACAEPDKPFGLMFSPHKTGNEAVVLLHPTGEQIRRMKREYRRSR